MSDNKRDNQSTRIFNRHMEHLKHLREIIMKNGANEKATQNLSKFISEHKLVGPLIKYLIHFKAIEKFKETSNPRDGLYLRWIYKGNGDGEVDSKLVSKILDHDREVGRNYYNNSKDQKKTTPVITAAVLEKQKFDPDTAESQILWLNNKLAKHNTTGDYLRTDEVEMFVNIRENLETMITTYGNIEAMVTGMNGFLHRIKPASKPRKSKVEIDGVVVEQQPKTEQQIAEVVE